MKALEKSGFVLDRYNGRGSHVLAIDPKTGQFITVQYSLHKVILIKILKRAEQLGYNPDEIMKNY